jgi:cystathionine beta-lyase
MKFNFEELIDRRDSDSAKWNRYENDVLPLWVADMDFLSPPPVIDALRDRLNHGLFGYSFTQDSTKNTICSWLDRWHGWSVSPEEIFLSPGVVPAFNIATRAFTNPGDSVLIQTPAYHPFLDLSKNTNVELSNQSLRSDTSGRYEINILDFKEHLLPTTRIFMLCNPHNPTGRVFQEDELISMAEACLERNVIICSDEIHCDLVYTPNRHIPIASISEEIAQNTITLISPSKTFNLAGLKSSVVIIKNAHLRELFIKHARGFTGAVNILGEVAMNAAYSLCDNWLQELLSYLENNRKTLFEFVNNELPGVSMSLPEGTYLGWLDFTKTIHSCPSDFLLKNAHVALNAGEWFGEDFSKFARINFGCQAATLTNALDRIKSAFNST